VRIFGDVAPAIYQDLVIIGSRVPNTLPEARVVWYALSTFARQTRLDLSHIPQPAEVGHESWDGDAWKERSGANVWSIMSVDAERGLVFLPIGLAS